MKGIDKGRHDLFISFHASEELSSVGLPGTTTSVLSRDVVKKVKQMVQGESRISSIFFGELAGSPSDIFKAVMQTRGGGVPLFLITKKYFTSAHCLAVLRAFMNMQARADRGGHVGVKPRFICLDKSVDDILTDPNIKKLVPGLSKNDFHADVANRGTLPAVANAIAKMVLDAWKGDSRTRPSNLGGTVEESFWDLCGSLSSGDIAIAKHVLGIRDPWRNMCTMWEVLDAALSHGTISYSNVELLRNVTTMGRSAHAESQREALTAYMGKWCDASSWEWGSDVFEELCNIETEARQEIAGKMAEEEIAGEKAEEDVAALSNLWCLHVGLILLSFCILVYVGFQASLWKENGGSREKVYL